MTLIHHSISRGLNVSSERSTAFVQAVYPDAAIREGFVTYGRTLIWIINAHHTAEDHVVFPYMRTRLPDAPFDELSANHLVIADFLKELQMNVEEVATQTQPGEALNALKNTVTKISELWYPHIVKEQLYIYDPKKVDVVMDTDEQIRLGSETAEYSLQQADRGFLIPFILYNLPPEERAYIAQTMPPVVIQELLPGAWKEKWLPMKPFFLD